MIAPNDGGPAFPTAVPGGPDGSWDTPEERPGMSFRDYFAGQALVGLLAHDINDGGKYPTEWFSGAAYRLADAMIVEREAKP